MSSEGKPAASGPLPFQTLAPIALVAGAVASEALMFRVGHRNQSIVIMLLFAGWVLAPFAAGALAHRKSRTWPASNQAILHGLMLLLAVVSPAIYANPPVRQPASVFLLVPLTSLVLLTIVSLLAAKRR